MLHAWTVAQIRDAEARAIADVGPDVLIQRAAAGLASAILRRLRAGRFAARTPVGSVPAGAYGARVLLVVGSGNNGADALLAGAILAGRGVRVSAWRSSDRVHEAGWAALRGAGGREVDAATALAQLPRQSLVVDGVAGIGSRPGLAPAVAG
ncbi:MAG: NAD(P)H-hydrate epimerase, partial [Nocardioides sp.]|uniref:NAD(P)H-hydrate epimerase n=1 Tax=Nocardioides sp. TaxID=35761 RepID=UPI0039E6531E